MGYTLTIGELEAEISDEYVRLDAVGVSLPDAPAFGEPTDHTNSRWPSYTAWHDFCREAGIEPLFYGGGWSREDRSYLPCPDDFHRERPLLSEHPGAAPITLADADYVTAATAARRASNGGRAAGFGDNLDDTLARLAWLDFWMRWAVTNCERPVVANS